MKTVILAGGYGSRISEETYLKPKPLVEIGGMPILWHIMKSYSSHDINDFVICCGYKGYLVKEYFANYFLHMSVNFEILSSCIFTDPNLPGGWTEVTVAIVFLFLWNLIKSDMLTSLKPSP